MPVSGMSSFQRRHGRDGHATKEEAAPGTTRSEQRSAAHVARAIQTAREVADAARGANAADQSPASGKDEGEGQSCAVKEVARAARSVSGAIQLRTRPARGEVRSHAGIAGNETRLPTAGPACPA